MNIDSHQHFWTYRREQYPWMNGPLEPLRRDFLPEHLFPLTADAGIDGVVTVQVRKALEETHWTCSLAEQHPEILGVVGWVDFTKPDVEADIDLLPHPKLKGFRHILQDEPANDLMDSTAFNNGVAHLHRSGLVYDLLIYERHLPQAIAFVDRHPNQIFVLDHIAKPRIREKEIEPWRTHFLDLARRPHVYCKLSGMVTEAEWTKWSRDDLAPYIDVALEAFGPRRLMFGSDWPVLTLASSYERWVETLRSFTRTLSSTEQSWIWSRSAAGVYQLAVVLD